MLGIESEKANVLVEALPYIQKYSGKTVVIKYGGNAMINEELKQAVIEDIVLLNLVGVRVVVVHGGGPEINDMLSRLGKESKFVGGLRYTDKETMEVALMVLCGKVNKNLVSLLGQAGGKGVGLCGIDGGMFKAKKLTDKGLDYGYVGEITKVDPGAAINALNDGYIPVIATVSQDEESADCYNVNADVAASKLAIALEAQKLILLTDVRGLLRDPKDENSLMSEVSVSDVPVLTKQGIISGGMIPKVQCCVEAIRNGVKGVNIQDGRMKHSILMELLSDEGVGTMFK